MFAMDAPGNRSAERARSRDLRSRRIDGVDGPEVAVLCWGRAAAAIQSEPLRADFSQRRRSGMSLDVAKGGTRWPDTSTHPGM
jgi:hypothetical protein